MRKSVHCWNPAGFQASDLDIKQKLGHSTLRLYVLELFGQGLQTFSIQDTQISSFLTSRASDVWWSEPLCIRGLTEILMLVYAGGKRALGALLPGFRIMFPICGSNVSMVIFVSSCSNSINCLLCSVPAAQRCMSSNSESIKAMYPL